MNINRKSGMAFEQHLCMCLYQSGFWVHYIVGNKTGQPADIIAAKNGMAFLIDAKVCLNNFKFSRVEANQEYSMKLWSDCGNGAGWFAMLCDNDILMISHSLIKQLMHNKTSLNKSEIYRYGIGLTEWIKDASNNFKCSKS